MGRQRCWVSRRSRVREGLRDAPEVESKVSLTQVREGRGIIAAEMTSSAKFINMQKYQHFQAHN